MEWRRDTSYDRETITDSWKLFNEHGTPVLWVRKEKRKWVANYYEGGVAGNYVKYNQPVVAAETLAEVKAVAVTMMHMS